MALANSLSRLQVTHQPRANQPMIGISYSGNSTEVTDAFSADVQPHSVLITANTGLSGTTVLHIQPDGIPLRYLPLLTYRLIVRMVESPFSGYRATEALPEWSNRLSESLIDCYTNNKIPVFTSTSSSWFARVFAEQFMEFLKRPAFHVHFPHFTHNLLWGLGGHNASQFYFMHEESGRDYSDNRQQKTWQHLEAMGAQQLVLHDCEGQLNQYTLLASCLTIYAVVCEQVGVEGNTEHSF